MGDECKICGKTIPPHFTGACPLCGAEHIDGDLDGMSEWNKELMERDRE